MACSRSRSSKGWKTGSADKNKDGTVTASELRDLVQARSAS